MQKNKLVDARKYKATFMGTRNGFNITTYEPIGEDGKRLAVMQEHVRQLGFVRR